jgi:hypothetical protein
MYRKERVMSTMQEALINSGNAANYLAQKREREAEQQRRANMAHAKRMRDKAIMQVHSLSYSRKSKDGKGGMLVPRKAELRERLAAAMQKAAVYAVLARPDNGYPAPPYRRDPEYPNGAQMHSPKKGLDMNHLVAERNRLVFWLQILKSRNAPEQTIQNVEAHILRLARRVDKSRSNPHVRKRPGTKEYTLRNAVVEYRR